MYEFTANELAQRTARHQQLLKPFFQRLALDLPELDESFWSGMRDCLLDAGATDDEIEAVAAQMFICILQQASSEALDKTAMEARRAQRLRQCDLLAEHLAQSTMHVGFGEDGTGLKITFPGRLPEH